MQDDSSDYRVVALINKTLAPGSALNAIAHLSLGLSSHVGTSGRASLKFLDFIDKSGDTHPSISARSLIVLRGTSADIRSLRRTAKARQILFVDFLETMTGGDYTSQLTRTGETTEDAHQYYGVILLGISEEIRALTRKYSLWK